MRKGLVCSWDPETKRKSAKLRDVDEPRSEKIRLKQGGLKVMQIIFLFCMKGVAMLWPVPIGTTISAQYYKMLIQDLQFE